MGKKSSTAAAAAPICVLRSPSADAGRRGWMFAFRDGFTFLFADIRTDADSVRMQLPVQANLAASKLVAAGGIRKEGCGKSSSMVRCRWRRLMRLTGVPPEVSGLTIALCRWPAAVFIAAPASGDKERTSKNKSGRSANPGASVC